MTFDHIPWWILCGMHVWWSSLTPFFILIYVWVVICFQIKVYSNTYTCISASRRQLSTWHVGIPVLVTKARIKKQAIYAQLEWLDEGGSDFPKWMICVKVSWQSCIFFQNIAQASRAQYVWCWTRRHYYAMIVIGTSSNGVMTSKLNDQGAGRRIAYMYHSTRWSRQI